MKTYLDAMWFRWGRWSVFIGKKRNGRQPGNGLVINRHDEVGERVFWRVWKWTQR